ncbi:MAG: hypothetical protein GC154_19040 [bacterium]|nr:hypothetical protein [bacterium]
MNIRLTSLAFLMLILTTPAGYTGDSLNAKELGVSGDGKTDDGPVLQKILQQAADQGGGEVYLPAGQYRIEDSIQIPSGVTLRGVWEAPHHADQVWGSVLLAVGHEGEEDGPALIQLSANSSVQGLTIFYPNQTMEDIKVYPWAIEGEGMHGSVIDVTLTNAYQGVSFGRKRNELHLIRNVYGCCLRRGVFIDQCTDIGRIENVHFNPHYWARAKMNEIEGAKPPRGMRDLISYLNANCEAFIFGRTDWEYVLNTFAYGFDKCYKFIETEHGACNGNFLGIGADGGNHAVWMEATQPPGLLITNGEFVTMAGKESIQIVATESYKGVAQFNNCSFWGPTDMCASIKGTGFVSFQQCNFVQWGLQGKKSPALNFESGNAAVHSSFFQDAKPHILLGPKVSSAVISGNQFKGDIQIDNQSQGDVQIMGNASIH